MLEPLLVGARQAAASSGTGKLAMTANYCGPTVPSVILSLTGIAMDRPRDGQAAVPDPRVVQWLLCSLVGLCKVEREAAMDRVQVLRFLCGRASVEI